MTATFGIRNRDIFGNNNIIMAVIIVMIVMLLFADQMSLFSLLLTHTVFKRNAHFITK